MSEKPLMAASTAARIDTLLQSPPHAFMLTGPAGMGKSYVANWIRMQFAAAPYELIIEPEKGKTTIGIDAVRNLEHFISLRIDSIKPVSRVVTIIDAQLLGHEAQNALLKTLEEPPAGTVLILSCSHPEALLSTVRSRVQSIEIAAPLLNELTALLPVETEARRATVIALSGGRPGLAFALATHDTEHPLVQAAAVARELLQASTFIRLSKVDTMSKNKLSTDDVLQILLLMAHAGLLSGRSPERWQKVQTAAYDAQRKLRANVQPKLVLTDLMLHL